MSEPYWEGSTMKNAVFFALLGLLLPMAFVQRADAAEASAKNETPYWVNGTITYATVLCRNDRPTIAPGHTWRDGIGACKSQIVKFTADGHQCELVGSRPGNPTTFVIKTGKAFGIPGMYCGFTAR